MKTLPEQMTPAVTPQDAVNFSASGSSSSAAASSAAAERAYAAWPLVDRRAQNRPDGVPPRQGKHSRFIFAAILFVALNAGLSFGAPFDFDPYRFVYRGWVWWTMNALKSDTEIHNVALLGSSLMVSAVSGADANHFLKSFDLTNYHKAGYFDHLLQKKLHGEFNTFNLAAPGQMPSDAYLTLKGMVNISQRPEVVIYGIAPRDFIDSTLSSPMDTEPFKYLRRIVPVDDIASGLYRSPIPRLDWFLQRTCYMYGNSLDIQMETKDYLNSVVSSAVPQPKKTRYPFTWWDRTHVMPNYLAGEIIPNSMMSVPITHADAERERADNVAEYRERYKRPDPSTYQTQFYFLRKLASFCHKEKIELVLVNMPLSQENISLMKPDVYLNYVQAIRQFGFNMNISVIDLCWPAYFTRADFHDTVHLNAFGGKKFLWHLADILGNMPRTRRALTLAGAELQRHEEDERRIDAAEKPAKAAVK